MDQPRHRNADRNHPIPRLLLVGSIRRACDSSSVCINPRKPNNEESIRTTFQQPRYSCMSEQEQETGQENGQEQQEYVFHPADLVEYAMDKPIGAARAALVIGLEGADVYPDIIIDELAGNMELNQRFLRKLTSALRKDPSKIIADMPYRIRGRQLERDINL